MNTANWIPDLFLQRVEADGEWTLFSPDERRICTTSTARRSASATRTTRQGGARRDPGVQAGSATELWRKMLTMLFETGHPVDHVQGPLQPALAAAARRRRALLEPLHGDHAQHVRRRDRRLQSRLDQSADARERRPTRSSDGSAHRRDRDADARQRHRHQLLHRSGSAPLEPAAPPGRSRADGLPGRAAGCGSRCFRCGGRLRRHQHGADLLLRHLGLGRAGRRARALSVVRRLAVEPGHFADRFDRTAGGSPRRPSRWTAARRSTGITARARQGDQACATPT